MNWEPTTRKCVGYEGHECGELFETRARTLKACRCPLCQGEHKKLLMRAWQKKQRAHDRAREAKKLADARRECFTHSTLQRLGTWKFIKVVSQIVRGEAEYVG